MTTETTTWQMFAHSCLGTFTDIGSRPYVVAHGLPYPIVPVEVRLVSDDDPAATHWGWISSKRDDAKPSMIWHGRGLYEMCFIYVPDADEKAGRGRTVRLVVTATQDGGGR